MPKNGPVFVVGCPRSGTSLLYSMLESAGGFAVYRAETRIFDLLGPHFGNLLDPKHLPHALAVWEKSDQCSVAGLDFAPVRRRILEECRNTGDFLRIFMESVASQQGAPRWAENTPGHLLFMREIKRTIPNALFVHIVRDGRDVAVSLDKQGWIPPFRWDRSRSILVAGLYWKWLVTTGMKIGRTLGADYMEVHYEDLLSRPQETLDRIGAFVGHDLDYERIQQVGISEVRRPNTSFPSDANFIRRWRRHLTPLQVAQLEYLTSPLLEEQGYEATAPRDRRLALDAMRTAYFLRFAFRDWAKKYAPFGRHLVSLDALRPGAIYGDTYIKTTVGNGCGTAVR